MSFNIELSQTEVETTDNRITYYYDDGTTVVVENVTHVVERDDEVHEVTGDLVKRESGVHEIQPGWVINIKGIDSPSNAEVAWVVEHGESPTLSYLAFTETGDMYFTQDNGKASRMSKEQALAWRGIVDHVYEVESRVAEHMWYY
jgi:hypothetical protein